jgi:DNA-binding NarL/FixJ family response regulator
LTLCAAQADLLVLDLSLYGPPGHEVLPELRQSAPYCNVVIYTAFDTLGVWADDQNVYAVIHKAEPDKLEAELQRLAADHRGFVSLRPETPAGA